MEPFTLSAGEIVLDVPVDAEIFVREVVRGGWSRGDELTWAIRHDGKFLGVLSVRAANSMVGYWIGAEHRGTGYMSRAVTALIDWVFESGWSDIVRWEARVGNTGSLALARKTGFQFTGIGPAYNTPARDGSSPPSWRAELHKHDDRSVKDGWPDVAWAGAQ